MPGGIRRYRLSPVPGPGCRSSRVGRPVVMVLCLLLEASICLFPACKADEDKAESADEAVENYPQLVGFAVTTDNDSLEFQYIDAVTKMPVRTSTLSAIPDGARSMVVVLSSQLGADALPPDRVIVADFTAEPDGGSYPFKVMDRFSFMENASAEVRSAHSESAGTDRSVANGSGAPNRVTLFTIPGCSACKRAIQWLKEESLPFEERNVATDPAAQAELEALGRSLGYPPQALTTFPIIHVGGQLVFGLDVARIQSLL